MAGTPRAPWKRSNPRKRAGKASKHLTSAQKSAAKARARRAGRRYPNLVDNMRMAAKKTSGSSKARTSAKKTSTKKTRKRTAKKTARKTAKSARKRRASAREKDPRGGLTAAGRKAFARKQGAHLRPGVTKKESEMTPQENAAQGQLGGALLWPRETAAAGRCEGTADPPRIVGACLGRACSEDGSGSKAHCGKGRAPPGALSPHQGACLAPGHQRMVASSTARPRAPMILTSSLPQVKPRAKSSAALRASSLALVLAMAST